MTEPSFCVLCACIHGRSRRALPPAPGVPALCVECRRSCERGDGAAEAARRPVPTPIDPLYEQASVRAALALADHG